MVEIPPIKIGNEVKILNQPLIFTVTDEYYDEYSRQYFSLVYCYDKVSDYPAGIIELTKVSADACRIWLF